MKKNATLALFTKAGNGHEILNQEIPDLKEGEILIKNEYSTLCRSDLNTFCGKRIEKSPTILGHETVGRIVEIFPGSEIKDENGALLKIGDRVTFGIYASDPNSEMSKKGIPQKSNDLFKYGHEEVTDKSCLHGGLATHLIIRKNTPILKLNENIPVEVAAIINCSVATVAGALRLAGDIKDKSVLVFGAGMLGIIACSMSKYLGASTVVVADINMERLVFAKNFGADSILSSDSENSLLDIENNIPHMSKYDVIIELSGAATAMETSLDFLNIGGVTVWVGGTFPQRSVNINPEKLIRNLQTIKGLHNYNSFDLIAAVKFIEDTINVYQFIKLIEGDYALLDIDNAFKHGLESNAYRVGIKF